MFRSIERFTSILFTHKAKDAELEGAIDAFYCEQCRCVHVSHKTHCFGDYRITTIRTTYEHPTTQKLLRYRQTGSDEIPTNES